MRRVSELEFRLMNRIDPRRSLISLDCQNKLATITCQVVEFDDLQTSCELMHDIKQKVIESV